MFIFILLSTMNESMMREAYTSELQDRIERWNTMVHSRSCTTLWFTRSPSTMFTPSTPYIAQQRNAHADILIGSGVLSDSGPLTKAVVNNNVEEVERILLSMETAVVIKPLLRNQCILIFEYLDGVGIRGFLSQTQNLLPAIAALLMNSARELNRVDLNGLTPLMKAAKLKTIIKPTLLRLVISESNVNTLDYAGHNAVYYAAEAGHVQNMQTFIEAGVDMSAAVHIPTGRSAIMCTSTPGVFEILKDHVDINQVDLEGRSALHHAVLRQSSIRFICLLIRGGINVSLANANAKTAADLAHDSGFTLVEALLRRVA